MSEATRILHSIERLDWTQDGWHQAALHPDGNTAISNLTEIKRTSAQCMQTTTHRGLV